MKKQTLGAGLLIVLGVFLLMNQGSSIEAGNIFSNFWAAIFIIPLGVLFHWMYFSLTGAKGVGLLIPGGVLLTVGVICQIATLFDSWDIMWPGFILAPAVGLFEFYWFGPRNKFLLIPINILTVLSLLFFVVFSIGPMLTYVSAVQPFIAIVLLLAGVWMMLGAKKRQEP
ncbi:hypothetical protein [Paenibacillus campinasensis]|uniref:DUF5668 domain-containing protein n=1 Tax=Paenibacillus campinasensis TaxID=66347 RepID=A0A268EPE0_9BACL|nr:hypothetical protein [Paenibacillus campinasensis]MUG66128.1 hypothetical protein [Paenibacillus campinasensis]PAD74961.1 hypothetical protein CHH67_16915 [Paenibacillus campinasensis]